ncbi:SDR family NAD(P)-dependent oxidoreductase [Microbacterium oryzae]|uniref:SDR family NAD(P)-dependent oxidoreductase n=1 Tax=Microbacterium oryzae TaxID=743009 RepID=UPI0025B1DF2E|nr:SDR family NAD(P)-dependent oxidoreductase [Microbacterium oryzae]MDN3310278.1 SDR family NAD(P)-dependent oxidoreductase [Microbacterium oryzae]
MTSSPRQLQNVLITGASSGLGAEFAAQLAARGSDLVLVARRKDRLRELADRLERDHRVRVRVVPLDLAAADAATALRERLEADGVRIDGLVNNAGFGMRGALAEADPERLDAMVRTNVGALAALTREFLPDILAARGALVNVASTAAYQPCPGMAAYGASKAFVLSFTEAIAEETRGSGARVLAISPGPTRTEFFDEIGTRAAAFRRQQSVDEVVRRALSALDAPAGAPSVVSGRLNALAAGVVRLLPRRAALRISGRALA